MCTCTSEKGKIHFQITSFREKSYLIIQFDLIKYILNKKKKKKERMSGKYASWFYIVVVVTAAIPRSTQENIKKNISIFKILCPASYIFNFLFSMNHPIYWKEKYYKGIINSV